MTEVCFVLAPGQNHFFVEVAEAMKTELAGVGLRSEISRDDFPPLRDGLVYVLVPPHEFRGLAPPEQWPTQAQLERTMFYCFEQPGTKFFRLRLGNGRGGRSAPDAAQRLPLAAVAARARRLHRAARALARGGRCGRWRATAARVSIAGRPSTGCTERTWRRSWRADRADAPRTHSTLMSLTGGALSNGRARGSLAADEPPGVAAGGERSPVLVVEGVSKSFRVAHERAFTVKERALHPFRSREHHVLEALTDISFELDRGEWLQREPARARQRAFAVMMQVDADVLLIDEVLAVGDAVFQRKCLETLEMKREQGCGVVLVTHDMDPVQNRCDRAILRDRGRVLETGAPEEIIASYNELNFPTEQAG